jgi:MOSC domain-containing protein YiiM
MNSTSNDNNSHLRGLTTQFAQTGKLEAIFLRTARGEPCQRINSVQAIAGKGLLGDRASLKTSSATISSKRQVTLIQAEHIQVLSLLLNKTIHAEVLRRNLVVSGINLLATKSLFKNQPMQLMIGEVILEVTGPCEPCSKMEVLLGKGGYNAMRGHGGITAKVIKGGNITLNDSVLCTPVLYQPASI